MTTFTTAQLPTGINAITTVEGLKVWADMILHSNAIGEDVIRQEGEASIKAVRRNFYTDKNKLERMEIFSHVQLESDWATNGKQPWASAIPFNNVAIPADFSA